MKTDPYLTVDLLLDWLDRAHTGNSVLGASPGVSHQMGYMYGTVTPSGLGVGFRSK